MPEAHAASATTLIHRRVKSVNGEELGRIEDLVIDLEQGFIAYVVLEFADLADRPRYPRKPPDDPRGEHAPHARNPSPRKLFVIPWGAMVLDRDDRAFVLNVDREVFRNAPGLADDERPGARRWSGGGVPSSRFQVSR